MYRQSVTSSRISSIGYESSVLEVEFKNGAVYQYYDVSEQEYISLMASGSLGRALAILDKKHQYRRVK